MTRGRRSRHGPRRGQGRGTQPKPRENTALTQQKSKVLREKLKAAFTSIRFREDAVRTQVNLHVGPANSGKTYDAIESLKKSGSGLYLAPLRLLAWEVADKLNVQGYPCSLVTGEERVIVPGAPYVSSTVEMFNPEYQGECIVLDEAQMLADEQRGWAWMRVIANAQSSVMEIIASPDAENLISSLLTKVGYGFNVVKHKRLAPLTVATKPWRIDQPEPHTIFVVFSRAGVLSLKTYLEKRGWSVSAIYGNLPPEVKRKQAERFLTGEAQLCVATDAIGMGINLPAARVCFTTVTKYDGTRQRVLTPAEARQIAGRAGRYGVKEFGEAGALTIEHVTTLNELLAVDPPNLEFARVTPELSDLEMIEGNLAHRLAEWETHHAVPEYLRDVILPADLEQQKLLANFLKEEEMQKLGLATLFTLIKAPSSRDSTSYWYACVRAIMENRNLPLPLILPQMVIENKDALLAAEQAVEQCDIYLWVSNREEFKAHVSEQEKVLNYKWELINKIDQTLAVKMDMRQQCKRCNKVLPLLHPFSACEGCFQKGSRGFFRKPNKHTTFKH